MLHRTAPARFQAFAGELRRRAGTRWLLARRHVRLRAAGFTGAAVAVILAVLTVSARRLRALDRRLARHLDEVVAPAARGAPRVLLAATARAATLAHRRPAALDRAGLHDHATRAANAARRLPTALDRARLHDHAARAANAVRDLSAHLDRLGRRVVAAEPAWRSRWEARLASLTLAGAVAVAGAGATAAVVQHRTTAVKLLAESRAVTTRALEGSLPTTGPRADEPREPRAVEAAAAEEPTVTVPPAPPSPPARRGALPVGKGMWLWQPDRIEGGDVDAIVARATHVGLTHLYVRTGSSPRGFYAGPFLDRLLPAAHEAGLRVYGWDFPYFDDVAADIDRAVAAITHEAPGGHRLDGFVPDIETAREGVRMSPANAAAYGAGLRAAVGSDYPLVVAVPRPNPALRTYPFPEVVAHFDAIAPMVYWLSGQPEMVGPAVQWLGQFGKPVIPIGQAYDGALEGGRPGPPPRGEILRFMSTAEQAGAIGTSFWSWQHASQEVWDAIRDAREFSVPAGPASELRPADVRQLQALLTSLGYPTGTSGMWDPDTVRAVRRFQFDAGLRVTGRIDEATRALLLAPFPPPLADRDAGHGDTGGPEPGATPGEEAPPERAPREETTREPGEARPEDAPTP